MKLTALQQREAMRVIYEGMTLRSHRFLFVEFCKSRGVTTFPFSLFRCLYLNPRFLRGWM